MPNRLAGETSPYLLQHAHNPVNWYPWGPEAWERARLEDKPVFLSVGYSACHWCHVMEHESFENPEIAAKLNAHFVSVKVDREERPDVDQIYMHAVQMMTGHGGWPMSVFLTPQREPFFGGTYWPPEGRGGMPGFGQVLDAVADAWRSRREQAVAHARELAQHLARVGEIEESSEGLRLELLVAAAGGLEQIFDFTHGGFGGAPKFPHPMSLQLLLHCARRTGRSAWRDMAALNLDKMARGGIYDHLAGGFARYSVDERWLVPHFEKMLYDNALLANAYLDGYLATGRGEFATVVRDTLDYVLREMRDPTRAFHSSEDADSEGEEGKYYLWSRDEVLQALGSAAGERFCYVYDVTAAGNFEGRNILNLPKTISQCASLRGWDLDELTRELAESRRRLREVREKRVRPGRDDKILVSWNALMIDALARAAGAFGEAPYRDAAVHAAEFLLAALRRPDGRLLRSWRQGQARHDACLDDYACLIQALVTLYEATFDERWIDDAARLAEIMVAHFRAPRGGFYFTADDQERLIARPQDWYDSSVPSGNAMAATGLLRLGTLTGRREWVATARDTLQAGVSVMTRAPAAAGQALIALDLYLGPCPEIVLVGPASPEELDRVMQPLRCRFFPNRVLAARTSTTPPHRSPFLAEIFAGRDSATQLTACVCERFACQTPVTGSEAIRERFEELAGSP